MSSGAAVDRGARKIVLGLGGSATTDGGAGLMTALGARLVNAAGALLPPGGTALRSLARLDLSGLDPRLASAEIVVACDVDNPLVGPEGAAAVYGPQKGADTATINLLDEGLNRWADRIASTTGADKRGVPGAGAAGGTAFAVIALLNGRIVSGIDFCLQLSRLADLLPTADVVIIGEGSLDAQSLRGKGPAILAGRARKSAKAIVAVSGRCTLTPAEWSAAGIDAVYTLTDLEPDVSVCIRDVRRLLSLTAVRIADDWLTPHER